MGEEEEKQSAGSCGNWKTKRIRSETGGIDWISQLPDSVIVQILSLLTLTDACKTAILSKRWQYLWTYIDNLNFDSRDGFFLFKTSKLNSSSKANRFISFTDNVMRLHRCSNIKEFSLEFVLNHDDVSTISKIDKWLEIAVNKNVKDLYLKVWVSNEQPYTLPQVLCNNSSLVELNCKYCKLSENCVLNWPSLKSLTLTNLLLWDENIKQISSGCPQLESLELSEFCGFHHLHITSPKCTRLLLIDHRHPLNDSDPLDNHCFFDIVAPFVQHLEISGAFHGVKFRLRDISSLVHADLNFHNHTWGVTNDLIDIKEILADVRCASELTVPSWFIEVISKLMLENADLPLPLLECRWLTINSFITKCSFLGIGNLLSSTPYLENLTLLPEQDFLVVRIIHNDINFWGDDIDVLGNKFLSFQGDLIKGSLEKLKNSKVILAFCGDDIFKDDTTGLTQLLKSLLEHARNMVKLVISLSHWRRCNTCSARISKIIENLLGFPEDSKCAFVINPSCED